MNITLVSPYDPRPSPPDGRGAHVGGVERVLGELARSLGARGHDVTLLCSAEGPGSERVEGGVRVVRETRRATVLRAPIAALAARVPADADLVHVPATYPFTTAEVLRAAHRRKIPAVLDFHFEPLPPTALGRMAAHAYRWVGPRAYRLARTVLVRSMEYGRSSRSLGAVPEERWRVVPNGIDPARFRPNGRAPDGDYVLFVGRLVSYKGVEYLLRAMALLPRRMPLVVAGDGPLRHALEALAQRLGVEARFLGRVSDAELPRLYRRARVTVLPSINRQEAFGLAILESMACGTPVVASDLPGVAGLARLGGLVAPPRDVAALADRLRQAIESNDLARGAALATRICKSYSWDAVTDRLLAAYAEVTGRPIGVGSRPTPAAVPSRAPAAPLAVAGEVAFADSRRRPVL